MRLFGWLSQGGVVLSLVLTLGCGGGAQKATPESAVEGGGVANDLDVPSIIPTPPGWDVAKNGEGRNGSDPFAVVMDDGWLYLYTSSDIPGNTDPNKFPMDTTYVYSLPLGSNPGDRSQWWDEAQIGGPALKEDDFPLSDWWWGNGRPDHLWAPEAIYWPWWGELALKSPYYLYVPDVESTNVFSNSWIAVATSSVPYGPFSYQTYVRKADGSNLSAYASDPSPQYDANGNQYLVFADGYGQNCGGLAIAYLNWSDPTVADSVARIRVNGMIEQFGYDSDLVCDPNNDPNFTAYPPVNEAYKCDMTDKQNKKNWQQRCTSANTLSGQYLEGASLYYLDANAGVNPAQGPWYLVFPRKPQGKNQAISYATASSLQPNWYTGYVEFQYQGDILAPSTTSWTNQASIVRWNNQWLLFYHDAKGSTDRNRKVHMECMYFNDDGTIAPVTRSSSGNPWYQYCANNPQPVSAYSYYGSITYTPGNAVCHQGSSCTQYFGSDTAVTLYVSSGVCPLSGSRIGYFTGCDGGTNSCFDGGTCTCVVYATYPRSVTFNCQ